VGGADCITFFVASSTGGTTWTTKTYSGGGSAVAEYLAYGNSTFVTVGGYRPSGNIVVTSGNGNSWTSTTTFLSGENNRNPSGLIFENKLLSTSCTLLLRGDNSDSWFCKLREATANISAEQSTVMISKFRSSEQSARGIAAVPVPSSAILHVVSGFVFCHFRICLRQYPVSQVKYVSPRL